MKCIKCGKEAKTSFCEECLREMAKKSHDKYPLTYDEDGELVHKELRLHTRRVGEERRTHAERRKFARI